MDRKENLNYLFWLIQVPTINQDTGIPSPTEPTETLQTYRSGEVLLRSHKNKRQVIVACIFSVEHITPYADICRYAGEIDSSWLKSLKLRKGL
jgi:hypothetical protein